MAQLFAELFVGLVLKPAAGIVVAVVLAVLLLVVATPVIWVVALFCPGAYLENVCHGYSIVLSAWWAIVGCF